MISSKLTLASVLAGALALSACTDPGRFGAQPGDPNQKTKNGALIGAGAGALLGALSKGDGNRGDGALKGALIGGALGAGVGYALDKQEAELRQQMGNDVVIRFTRIQHCKLSVTPTATVMRLITNSFPKGGPMRWPMCFMAMACQPAVYRPLVGAKASRSQAT